MCIYEQFEYYKNARNVYETSKIECTLWYIQPPLCILIFLKFIPTLISFIFFSLFFFPPINCIKSRVRDDSRVSKEK